MDVKYIYDDFELARKFVAELPLKEKVARFPAGLKHNMPINFDPHHVMVAVRNGVAIAMADILVSEGEQNVASISIVAKPKYGSNALICMLRLKAQFKNYTWIATVSKPTKAIAKISFRYIDVVYDQKAYDFCKYLMSLHGELPCFTPIPIFNSKYFLKAFGLSSIDRLPNASKHQILEMNDFDPSKPFMSPNENILDHAAMLLMAFEVTNAPIIMRQHLTRILPVLSAGLFGQRVSKTKLRKVARMKYFGEWTLLLKHTAANLPYDGEKVFKEST